MGNDLKDTLYLSTNHFMYKRLYYTGVAGYIVLLVFSVLFYKERVIFVDTTFTIFHIIRDSFFRIEAFRFGDIFNQILPVLAVNARLSLNAIMMAYSLGFIIYYFICYIICGSILKQFDFALVILLLNVLFVTETFYWIPSELPQGMALLILTFAFARNKQIEQMKPVTWATLVCLLITLAFFHLILAIVLLYSIVFFTERKNVFKSRKILYTITVIFFCVIIVKALAFRSPYEQHAMGGLKNFITQFPDYFTLYSNKQFLHNCVTRYYWIPLLLLSIVIQYTTLRKWRQLAFFLFAFFGYLMLVNISYPTQATPQFYIENLHLPLAYILALPFVIDVIPTIKKGIVLPIICLTIISGCIRIYITHNMYTSRLSYERRIIDKYDGQKVIVKASKADIDTLQLLWSNPYEFLLLSACERGKPASILIDENPERLGWAREKRKELIVNSDIVPYKALPVKYFRFSDTVNGYNIIPDPQLK